MRAKRTLWGALAAAAFMAFAPAGGGAADTYWQCVPLARLISGIQIFGDAWTWWQQAAGRYETGFTPRAGAVLCFKPTARMRLGHVAVVSQVLTDRVVLFVVDVVSVLLVVGEMERVLVALVVSVLEGEGL